jgi:F-type H+-transporting ATPase subunit delta
MTARTSAIRYARALFDVALKEQTDLDGLQRELSGLVGLLQSHESLRRALMSPAVPAPKKRAIVDAMIAQSPVPPILGKLLTMLADRDRLTLLPDLSDAFQRRLMDHRHIVRAEVATAVEMPADRITALKEGLEKATGRDVTLETRVDPSLVGGAVARIGSTVYDGSVTTQLQKVKERLVNAAAE